MFIHKPHFMVKPTIMVLSLMLTGCAGEIVTLDTTKHQDVLVQDRALVEHPQQVVEMTLTQALARGVEKNLDARVAQLEILAQEGNITLDTLNALPSLSGSYGAVNRSNEGGTSSRSLLSGQESLEPSQSTDERRRVSELKASWNLLDAALALSEAQSARDETRIARERYDKVIQNIERDVYAAYWRALAFQNNRVQTQNLLREAQVQAAHVKRAAKEQLISLDAANEKLTRLGDRQRSLRELYSRLSTADVELKGLLSIAQSAEIKLSTPSSVEKNAYKTLLNGDIATQEWRALKSRPEMREDILKKNMALRDIREEVIKTLPGGELMYSYNRDSNQFLADDEWTNFSASIVQNILNIFTLPARYAAAEDKAALTDARRQALSAAILAQVHLARQRMENTDAAYRDMVASSAFVAKRSGAAKAQVKHGFTAGLDAVLVRMDGQIDVLRTHMALAEVEDSYAAYLNTLGMRLTSTGGDT